MQIEAILDDPENSILLITPGENRDVVIGAPHHAPLGVPELPCADHSMSDENAGLIGYHLSRLLNCRSIIACNYFRDANKDPGSDYCRRILSWKPKMLVEIHGHCSNKVYADIEISSGTSARNDWSLQMAVRLRSELAEIPSLQEYTVSGDFNKIYFKASRSFTIISDEWLPFHVELPWPIRKSQERSRLIGKALAKTIRGLLTDFNEIRDSNS